MDRLMGKKGGKGGKGGKAGSATKKADAREKAVLSQVLSRDHGNRIVIVA